MNFHRRDIIKKQWITLLALVLCALLVLGACAPQSAPAEEPEQSQTTEPAPTPAVSLCSVTEMLTSVSPCVSTRTRSVPP